MKGLSNQGLKAYISEYVTIAADEANLTEKSKKNRRCAFKRILTYLGGKSFNYDGIRDYIGRLRTQGIYVNEMRTPKPWGDNAIVKEIVLIRAFLNYLVKQKRITEDENFGLQLIKPKVHEKVRELPSLADAVRIIMAGTRQHPNQPRTHGDNGIGELRKQDYREGMLFVIDTGLRCKELISITADMVKINYSEPYVTINAKGGNEQKVVIPNHHIELIKKRLFNKKDKDKVFALRIDTCNDALKRGSIKLGLPNITMHDLRRIFARNLDENGATMYQIKDALRHSSVMVTQRYVQHGLSQMSRIVNTFHDRNREGLSIDKTLDFIEQANNRLIGSGDKFSVSVIKDNKGMTIRVSVRK